jgi:putative PIN family toxin of toxin-antitoxin system
LIDRAIATKHGAYNVRIFGSVVRGEKTPVLETFIERAILVEIIEKVRVCRDPKDDKILDLAINGQAKYIVS